MSQTQDQQWFTISEVSADWHELMVLQWPYIACTNGQLDRQCSYDQHITDRTSHTRHASRSPQSLRGLLLIFCPTEDRRLSWSQHTVGCQLAQYCLQLDQAGYQTCDLHWYESNTLPLEHTPITYGSIILNELSNSMYAASVRTR